jgi:ubiquinone/menaquinone biosynthesis C-methylase UbiE
MQYSKTEAASYGSLGIKGTTYEVSLDPAIQAMGDLTGKAVLDFGCGSGRTAMALRQKGASLVIGVDHDPNMLRVAAAHPAIQYIQIRDNKLPIATGSLQGALCANVFSEFSSKRDIVRACREIWRALERDSVFVIVTTNPDSIGCDYVSYRYTRVENPRSGQPISCLIKSAEPFTIQDYYWSTDDYVSAVQSAGFRVDELTLPTAPPGGHWLDETKVAPDLIIKCTRTARRRPPARRSTMHGA